MGYIEFSSENADYVMTSGLGVVSMKDIPDAAKDADAVVLERGLVFEQITDHLPRFYKGELGKDEMKQLLDDLKNSVGKPTNIEDILRSDAPDGLLVEYAYDNDMPIMIAEPYTQNLLVSLSDMKLNDSLPLTVVHSLYGLLQNTRIPRWLVDMTFKHDIAEKSDTVYLRNLLVAERTEKILVPYCRMKRPEKRPKIIINYDIGHLGMVRFLEDSDMRQQAISDWLTSGSELLPGLGDQVFLASTKMQDDSKIWYVKQFSVNHTDGVKGQDL